MSRPPHGGNLVWAAKIAGCPVSQLLDFSASINPLGPPASAITAIEQALNYLTSYPEPEYSQLRLALGEFHQLDSDWILPGNGSAELLTWASWELSGKDRTCLITPAFGDYWRALRTFGAQVQSCPIDSLGDSLLTLKNPQSLGLLLNNPHNPTGKLWHRDKILPYLDSFGLVVIDEAFMDFLPPSQEQSLIRVLPQYPNLVILRSLTKFYSLPGLRIGYAIAHPERLQRWKHWRDPWPINILADKVAQAVIQDRQFQQQTWDWLPPTRSKLDQGLKSITGLSPFPSAANFLLVQTDYPSSQLQEKLLQQSQILIRDCLSFPELGDRFFRVAVRTQDENQRLLDALKISLLR